MALLAGCPPSGPEMDSPVPYTFAFRIAEDGRGVTASAFLVDLETGSGMVELPEGASLSVNGTTLENDGVRFRAEISDAPAYHFTYQHEDGRRFVSTVNAPAAPVIQFPTEGGRISRSTGFVARWDNHGADAETTHDLELDLGITCDVVARVSEVEEEQFLFHPNALIASAGGDAGSDGEPSCEGVIARSLFFVNARKTGTMDPALGGDIRATVQSATVFLSVP